MTDILFPPDHDPLKRGPFPIRATINAELEGYETQLASYRLSSELGARSLLPIYIELHVNPLGGDNIPEMFAKAYDAPHAPLTQPEKGRLFDPENPGLLCLLSSTVKNGYHRGRNSAKNKKR